MPSVDDRSSRKQAARQDTTTTAVQNLDSGCRTNPCLQTHDQLVAPRRRLVDMSGSPGGSFQLSPSLKRFCFHPEGSQLCRVAHVHADCFLLFMSAAVSAVR